MEVDQQPIGVPDGWEVVATPSTPPPAKGRDFKILGVNIHVPAEQPARPDSNILSVGGVGVAPEDALMGGIATRAVVTSARSGGAVAGAVEAAKQATPLIKYEAAKAVYRGMGIPEPFAAVLASVTAGYTRGAKPVADAEATSPVATAAASAAPQAPPAAAGVRPPAPASPAPPSVSPGAAPAPGAMPSVPVSSPPPVTPPGQTIPLRAGETLHLPAAQRTPGQMSESWIANDLGLAARRTKVPLAPDQLQQAVKTVQETGQSPLSVIQGMQGPAAPKLTLSAADVSEIQRLTKHGQSLTQALQTIVTMRTLGARLPSTADVARRVAERNATGRWPE